MSTAKVKSIPDGMHSVTPHLVCSDADAAINFYQKAFGATNVHRMPGPDGKLMHGQIQIGDSQLMLANENAQFGMLGPLALKGSPVIIHLYVEDADAFVAKAAAAGAKVTMPVADMFWGDRYGVVEDPYGHRWSIATHTRDVTPAEMQQAMQKMCDESSGAK